MKTLAPSPVPSIPVQPASVKVLPRVKRILVPTDLSSLSRLGIDVAVSMACENPEASLALVHVIDPAPVAGVTDAGVPIRLGLETSVEQAEDELDRLKSIYGDKLPVTTRVITGHPSRTICQMARDAEFDLIVLSSHGRTGLERMLIGSVAEQIVQDSACPVLVVKPPKNSQGQFLPDPEELSLDEILVGYDNRPGAQRALGMAGKIAGEAHSQLTLIHAVPAGETWVAPDLLRDPGGESVVLSESMRELTQVKSERMPASADWQLRCLIGNPWDVMVDYARLHRCDLIVVGPHEHTRWGQGIMGSTAQRVVRLAPCAVLAVK